MAFRASFATSAVLRVKKLRFLCKDAKNIPGKPFLPVRQTRWQGFHQSLSPLRVQLPFVKGACGCQLPAIRKESHTDIPHLFPINFTVSNDYLQIDKVVCALATRFTYAFSFGVIRFSALSKRCILFGRFVVKTAPPKDHVPEPAKDSPARVHY